MSLPLDHSQQAALRNFLKIDLPAMIAKGCAGGTGSLGLLGRDVRIAENIQSYLWGIPAYAFLRELRMRSSNWKGLIMESVPKLLIEVEEWYFLQPESKHLGFIGKPLIKGYHQSN